MMRALPWLLAVGLCIVAAFRVGVSSEPEYGVEDVRKPGPRRARALWVLRRERVNDAAAAAAALAILRSPKANLEERCSAALTAGRLGADDATVRAALEAELEGAPTVLRLFLEAALRSTR